ncbi:SRPBCC family protein [Ekhidna sp.]
MRGYFLRQIVAYLIFSFCVSAQHPRLISEEGWKLEKTKYGVEVFSKSIEGYELKAFKASGLIDASLFTVYNVIIDIENYDKWYPDCEEGEVLSQNDSIQMRRIVFKLPWPFYRRDIINGFITESRDDGIFIEVTNAADLIPEKKKTIRVSQSEGYWLLKEEDGKTRMTYSAVGDASGIPAWIANIFLFDSPLTAIHNIREMVRKPEYQFIPDLDK